MNLVYFFLLQFLILFFSLLLPSTTYASFFKYPENPILKVGASNEWNSASIYGASVVKDDNTYKMIYGGHNTNKGQLGYAYSNDGLTWTQYQNNPIVKWDIINNYTIGIEHPALIKNNYNNTPPYKLWFDVYVGGNSFSLYYSDSYDCITWSQPQKIVFDIENSGWDSVGKSAPAVLFNEADHKYYMWFNSWGDNNDTWRFGFATSVDGKSWNKYTNPIMIADQIWEKPGSYHIGNPSVILANNTFTMYYHGFGGIGKASSNNGYEWIKDLNNPIVFEGSNVANFDTNGKSDPYIITTNNILYMYYNGINNSNLNQIGLATSEPLGTASPTVTPTSSPTITPTPTTAPTNTPSPSPTPTEIPVFSPIVLVPGMGASWNPTAMFSCNLNDSEGWSLANFVHTYDRLINTLSQKAYLKENSEYYIYSYDWRQPLDKQADNLKKYIDNILISKPQNTKVRFIGHSLGGLVIRSYITKYQTTHKALSVLTIGTPHSGSPLVYPIWENGEVWSDNLTIKIALTQLINHCRLFYSLAGVQIKSPFIKSKKETVQQLAPSVENILPVFDYLKNKGVVIKSNTLKYQNTWILNHPFNATFFETSFHTLSGNNYPTLRYINITQPSKNDIKLGNWLDGKPVSKEKTSQGDETVLNISSQVPGADNIKIDGEHGEIMSSDTGLRKILDFLDLSIVAPFPIMKTAEIENDNAITISTDKPATMVLTGPNNTEISSNTEIITFFDPPEGKYKLKITPNKSGTSYIHLTKHIIDSESEDKILKTVYKENKPEIYTFEYKNGILSDLKK
jgi:hypothetical protein